MKTKTLSGILLLLALGLLLPSWAPAAVVGHFTQVEGRVDLLKKGQLPAIQVKLQDGLEKGDVIRTKSLSKAQITFVDHTTLTIAPESRIAIEEYMVDESKGKRNAVLQMFQGVALAVVSKIYQSEEPNFTVKTHTAIMGIRGTEVGIRLYPNFSEFLNFVGHTRVRSNFAEVLGHVELGPEQGTRVLRGLPPTMAFAVSPGDKQQFLNQLNTGLVARARGKDSGTEPSGSEGSNQGRGYAGGENMSIVSISPIIKPTPKEAPDSSPPSVADILPPPVADTPPPPQVVVPPVVETPVVVLPVVVPPVVETPVVKPPVVVPPVVDSYHPVTLSYTGQYTMQSFEGHQNATYTGSLSLKNSTVQYTVVTKDPATPGDFVKSSSGSITWTVTGTLPLISSTSGTNTYSGPLTITGTTTPGGTVFTFSLQATYKDGKLTFDTSGPLTGTYAALSKDITPDFTSPGSSHKITPGSATITWTSTTAATSTTPLGATAPASTAVAAPTLTQTGPTPLAATAPATTSLTSTTAVTPALTQTFTRPITATALAPTALTSTTVAAPAMTSTATLPLAVSVPAATALTQTATMPISATMPAPSTLTTTTALPPVVTAAPITALPPAVSLTPAAAAPGAAVASAVQAASGPPGLSGSGPPGLSGGGPPGQLKDKSK